VPLQPRIGRACRSVGPPGQSGPRDHGDARLGCPRQPDAVGSHKLAVYIARLARHLGPVEAQHVFPSLGDELSALHLIGQHPLVAAEFVA